MSFTGFSEEDLQRIKSNETGDDKGNLINISNVKKLDKIGAKPKRFGNQYKLPILQQQSSEDAIDSIDFKKCKLSIGTPTSPTTNEALNNNNTNNNEVTGNEGINNLQNLNQEHSNTNDDKLDMNKNVADINMEHERVSDAPNNTSEIDSDCCNRKHSISSTPDIVRGVTDYSEDELAAHRIKLEELQLKQRIMEEQNKKRKEMLSKALADRTKQTAEEVLKLEKIKKELQVLDGQFSLDVAVLRKKIDQACSSYAEAEKHYLKIEKEFLQAKINLQKEKEKKELLTEHLCALITHNETRKAQKLETLMLELASDRKNEVIDVTGSIEDEEPVVIDGVDQRTGKIVELPLET